MGGGGSESGSSGRESIVLMMMLWVMWRTSTGTRVHRVNGEIDEVCGNVRAGTRLAAVVFGLDVAGCRGGGKGVKRRTKRGGRAQMEKYGTKKISIVVRSCAFKGERRTQEGNRGRV